MQIAANTPASATPHAAATKQPTPPPMPVHVVDRPDLLATYGIPLASLLASFLAAAFAGLALRFIGKQILIANKQTTIAIDALKATQDAVAAAREELDLVKEQQSLMERQTAILERQEALINARASLWLAFPNGKQVYTISKWGNVPAYFDLPLMIGNSGERSYVDRLNVELYLRADAEARVLNMTKSGFTTGTDRLSHGEERVVQYFATFDVVCVPGKPQMLNVQVGFPAPDTAGAAFRIFWRIVSPDGTFPSDTDLGELTILTI